MNIDPTSISISTKKDLKIDIDIDKSNKREKDSAELVQKYLDDDSVGIKYIQKCIKKLGFSNVCQIAQFSKNVIRRQGGNVGKLFISVTYKEMGKK